MSLRGTKSRSNLEIASLTLAMTSLLNIYTYTGYIRAQRGIEAVSLCPFLKYKMKTVTVRQMREIDRKAIEEYGIPSIALMENAGRRVANEAARLLPSGRNGAVAIFCGKGNNGGDGFVAARHLINRGIKARVYLVGKGEEVHPVRNFVSHSGKNGIFNGAKGDALINLNVLLKMNRKMEPLSAQEHLRKAEKKIARSDLLIDAILGTGTRGKIKGFLKELIDFLNETGKPILSVDVPSGLDADTGRVLGSCLKAGKTVSFAFAKKGFFLCDGPDYTGEVVVADIGIPEIRQRREKLTYS